MASTRRRAHGASVRPGTQVRVWLHQLGGFDREPVAALLGLPTTVAPLVVLTVGRRDGAADLPKAPTARERAPRCG